MEPSNPPNTNSNEEEYVSVLVVPKTSTKVRNLSGFWLLGLCNNFAFVVMLTAAVDILKEEQSAANQNITGYTTVAPIHNDTSNNQTDKWIKHCNPIGSGAILLADIVPTLIIKITAPLYIVKVPYTARVLVVILFSTISFPVVSFAHLVALSLLGVACASISGGLGEVTFLTLSTYFHRNTVSTWSSGTGGSGVGGALSYAAMTAAGLSPRHTLLVMLVVPVLMAISYFGILVWPKELRGTFKTMKNESEPLIDGDTDHTGETSDDSSEEAEIVEQPSKQVSWEKSLTLKDKFWVAVSLMKYVLPLSSVYFAEYFINQALYELLYFEDIWLPIEQQYRWYQVLYQIGVFISRSSVNLIVVKKTWIVSILQFINLFLLLAQVFFRFIPSIWIIFVIILWEGLMGGCAYVNTFYRISTEIEERKREFCMSVVTISDSLGTTLAGIVSIPVHNAICKL